MAKEDFYFKLYYKRLLTSTIGWKDDEFGAYVRLLIYQFDNGSIPTDMDEITRISPSAKKHWKLLSKKFNPDGKGGLINEFMNDVREDVNEKKKINQGNGKKGGRPRKSENPPVNRNETEIKPNGSFLETQTKGIQYTVDTIQDKPEREVILPIEECLSIALRDPRWVKANKTNEAELKEFNSLLERRAMYQKNPMDYKSHFSNWKSGGKLEETAGNGIVKSMVV